ncbi:MAG TPA: hypothetical protein VFS58_15920 [Steroidobacteraceae bacterium]|nr:hypothetical protein [Steroidobacteraceae bacterium]
MHPKLRKLLKVSGWTFGGLMLLLGTFVGLLLFPGFLFAHKLEQGNLIAYSDEDLSGSLEPVLREIDRRLATSAINDPALTHHIFFGHGNRMFGALQNARAEIVFRTIGMKPSPNYNASWPPYVSHIVTFDVADVAHDALLRPGWPGRLNLTHILTHEAAHTLVLARLRFADTARLPMWKAEGYPEYVAMSAGRSQTGYSLHASVARFLAADTRLLKNSQGDFEPMRYDCIGKSYLKDENDDFWHTCYYLSRVLVEYLLDQKGLTFDELVKPSVEESQTLRDLLRDYRAGAL